MFWTDSNSIKMQPTPEYQVENKVLMLTKETICDQNHGVTYRELKSLMGPNQALSEHGFPGSN